MTESNFATPVSPSLESFAQQLGETTLQRAQSFKTTVLLGQRLVFKFPEQSHKTTDTDHKEMHVLQLLAERLSTVWKRVVPCFVAAHEVEGVGLVQAHTRLEGEHPKRVTDQLASELGHFLRALHSIGNWVALIEFEGDKGMSFRDYLRTASEKFATKLDGNVDAKDWQLVRQAVARTKEAAEQLGSDPPLVLVHKDLHLGNLLVDANGRLSGVIDWAAAQTAPREWEFSILRQRLPNDWKTIINSYEGQLDIKLIDICGLIQSLRFWKSFPHQSSFVAQQRDHIKDILTNA
jgi:aminoglycoside phosphotransferase (APT) family kinase protein